MRSCKIRHRVVWHAPPPHHHNREVVNDIHTAFVTCWNQNKPPKAGLCSDTRLRFSVRKINITWTTHTHKHLLFNTSFWICFKTKNKWIYLYLATTCTFFALLVIFGDFVLVVCGDLLRLLMPRCSLLFTRAAILGVLSITNAMDCLRSAWKTHTRTQR